jgi:hypothetical protein
MAELVIQAQTRLNFINHVREVCDYLHTNLSPVNPQCVLNPTADDRGRLVMYSTGIDEQTVWRVEEVYYTRAKVWVWNQAAATFIALKWA